MVNISCPSDDANDQKSITGSRRRVPSLPLFLSSILITFGVPFHYGYQLTIVGPVQPVMIQFINESVYGRYGIRMDHYGAEAIWGATVASLFAGSIPGALFTQSVADNFGRKFGIIFANFAIAFCAGLSCASKFLNSIEVFVACRFFFGFFNMIGLGIGAVFLTECSPLHCRGAIGMITGIMIQFGSIFGAILAMPQFLGDQANWWLLFLLEVIMLIVVTVPMFTLHESPNFLVFRDQFAKAVDSIKFYWGPNERTNAILDEIRNEQSSRSNALGMLAILRQKKSICTRKGLLVGILMSMSMAFCGITVIDAFIVEVLNRTMKFSTLFSSLVYISIQSLGLFSVIFASLLVDRIGRRPLLFTSLSLLFCANLAISLILLIKRQSLFVNFALVSVILLHSFAMCCGVFPLSYFVANEIVAQHARSAVQGWSKMADAISRSIVLSTFLPVRNLIGDGLAYALFFLPALALIGTYLYFELPETKNMRLMEIEDKLVQMAKIKSKQKNGNNP